MKRKNIIFIGSFLSKSRGTKGIAEKLKILLKDECNIKLVSKNNNILLRFIDIIWNVLVTDGEIIHIDVYSNKAFLYADIASKIAQIRHKYIIMTLRGGMLAERYQKDSKYLLKVFARADILQSPSLFLKDFFGKQGIDVDYMPNFIDLSLFPYDRTNVQPYSLLWVRAFSPEYHPELAIEVLQNIIKKYPNTKLTMIGPDKGMLQQIKDMVKELDLEEYIEFKGKVSNEQLYKYYQTHTVYLNTTEYESFGVAVLEAASCGIPIVSTRVGEIPYMWEEGKEMLMSDLDEKYMAQEVIKIFDSSKLADELSNNARKKAESFDWLSIRPKWINLFDKGQNKNVL
jgi:glycosyltransferase involved in cell wall biosynthesis